MSNSKTETRSGIGVRSKRHQAEYESFELAEAKEEHEENQHSFDVWKPFEPIQPKIDRMVSEQPERVRSNSFFDLLNLTSMLITVFNFGDLFKARWPAFPPVASAEMIPTPKLDSKFNENKIPGGSAFISSETEVSSRSRPINPDAPPFGFGDKASDELSLLAGINTGDLASVQNLLKKPHIVQRINVPAMRGYPLLALSAMKSNKFIIKELIKAGAEVNAQTPSGDTALTLAANAPMINHEFLKLLLDHGANVFHKNKAGLGAQDIIDGALEKIPEQPMTSQRKLAEAAQVHITVYERFVFYELELNQNASDENILQHYANIEPYREWFLKQSFGGRNHLTLAVKHNRLEVAKQLVEWGADVNLGPSLDEVRSPTPLQIALDQSNYDMTKFLLAKGADPDLTYNKNPYPIIIAMNLRFNSPQHDNLVEELLNYPINLQVEVPFKIESMGVTFNLLDWALTLQDISLAKKFIEKGLTPTIMSFIPAMAQNGSASVQFLVDLNLVDINQKFPYGSFKEYTPLEYATMHRFYPAYKVLADANADLGDGTTEKDYLKLKKPEDKSKIHSPISSPSPQDEKGESHQSSNYSLLTPGSLVLIILAALYIFRKKLAKSFEKKPSVIPLDAKEIKQKAKKMEQYLVDSQKDINHDKNKHLGLDNSIANLNQDINKAKDFINEQLECLSGNDAKQQVSLSQLDDWLNLNDSKDGEITKQIARFRKEKEKKELKQKQDKQQKQKMTQGLKELSSKIEILNERFQKSIKENPELDSFKHEPSKIREEVAKRNFPNDSKGFDQFSHEIQNKIAALEQQFELISNRIDVSKAINNLKISYQNKLKKIFINLAEYKHISRQDFPIHNVIQHLSSTRSLLRTSDAVEEANKKIAKLTDIENNLENLEKDINALMAESNNLLEVRQLSDKVNNLEVMAIKDSIAEANQFIVTSGLPEIKIPARRGSVASFLDRVEQQTSTSSSQQSTLPIPKASIGKFAPKDKKKFPVTQTSSSFYQKGKKLKLKDEKKPLSTASKQPKKINQLKNVLEAALNVISDIEPILTGGYFTAYPQLCRQAMLGAMMFICKDLFNVLRENPIGKKCISMHININHYAGLLDGISSPEEVAKAFALFSKQIKLFQDSKDKNPDPENPDVFPEKLKENPILNKLLLPRKYKKTDRRSYFPSVEEGTFSILSQNFADALDRVNKSQKITPGIRLINQLAGDYIKAKANDQHESGVIDMEEEDFSLRNPEISLSGDRKYGNQLRHDQPSQSQMPYIEELYHNNLYAEFHDCDSKGIAPSKSNADLITSVRSFSHSPLSSTLSTSFAILEITPPPPVHSQEKKEMSSLDI